MSTSNKKRRRRSSGMGSVAYTMAVIAAALPTSLWLIDRQLQADQVARDAAHDWDVELVEFAGFEPLRAQPQAAVPADTSPRVSPRMIAEAPTADRPKAERPVATPVAAPGEPAVAVADPVRPDKIEAQTPASPATTSPAPAEATSPDPAADAVSIDAALQRLGVDPKDLKDDDEVVVDQAAPAPVQLVTEAVRPVIHTQAESTGGGKSLLTSANPEGANTAAQLGLEGSDGNAAFDTRVDGVLHGKPIGQDLGPDTTLRSLGIQPTSGASDLVITDSLGTTFQVNLEGAVTIEDVLVRIREAAEAAGSAVYGEINQAATGLDLLDPRFGGAFFAGSGGGPGLDLTTLGILGGVGIAGGVGAGIGLGGGGGGGDEAVSPFAPQDPVTEPPTTR